MTMARIVPREKWLYDDRCMMNWLGWLLADHSTHLEQTAAAEIPSAAETPMSVAEVEATLQAAWQQTAPVAVQLNVQVGAGYMPDIVGVISGWQGGRLYLQQASGALTPLVVADIRHVRRVDPTHWWAA